MKEQENKSRLIPFEQGRYSMTEKVLDLSLEDIGGFCRSRSINVRDYFEHVFALTLACFAGSDSAFFFSDKGLGGQETWQQVFYPCSDRTTSEFLNDAGLVDQPISCSQEEIIIFRCIGLQKTVSFDLGTKGSPDAGLLFELMLTPRAALVQIMTSGQYPAWFAESMAETFESIAGQLYRSGYLHNVLLLPKAQQRFLDTVNATEKQHAFESITEGFAYQVAHHGDATAIGCGEDSLSYYEADRFAKGIGKKLKALGIGSGDRVGIILPPCLMMPVSVLGVLKTGASYVPIGEAYPDTWKQQVLSDAKVKAILTFGTTNCVNPTDCPVIDLETIQPCDQYHGPKISPDSEAAVIFTSGSTGIPKGVMLCHSAVANLCQWFAHFAGLTAEDRVAMYQNFAFVSHIEPMFGPCFVGASTFIVPEEMRLDMALLNAYYMQYGITVSKMGASAGRQFIHSIDHTSLRLLYLSGEKLGDISLPEDYRVVDAYGPTENTAQITAIFADEKTESTSVGFPIDNVKIFVLDDFKRRVPLGAVGRLYVTGAGLSSGYLNRPEMMNSFILNPFVCGKNNGLLYDTGDFVRLLEDGSLSFIGRKDDQIKIHGCRVELSEVTAVIEQMPEIQRCICMGVPSSDGRDNRLVAYVTPETDQSLYGHDLVLKVKKAVAAAKPKYMIPSFVIPMESFPLTPNGKVDKRKLPKPESVLVQKEYVAPKNAIEIQLCEAFETIFGLEQVGIDDDFIELGGDSLYAMVLLSDLTNLNITAADILRNRTPRKIAACANQVTTDFIQEYAYSYEKPFPFSTFQMAVYYEVHSKEEKDNELMPCVIDIPERYSQEEILSAVNQLFDIHPILCAYCDESSGTPMNIIGSKPVIQILESDDQHIIERFHIDTIDYHRAMSRFMLVKTEKGHRLHAEFHHMISDIACIPVFKKHFIGLLQGETYPLDVGMLEQAAFEKGLENSPLYKAAGDFFATMLAPVDLCQAVKDQPGGEKPGNLLKYYDVDRRKLAKYVQKNYSSLGAFYTAVFGLTLAHFSHAPCAAFLVAENDRDRLHLHDSFGAYTKLVPILIDARHESVSDFLAHATETFYELCNYDYYSLEQLYTDYPLTNTFYMDYLPGELSEAKLGVPDYQNSYRILNGEDEIAQCDFYSNVMETPTGFAFFVEHSEMFSRTWVETFCDTFHHLVNQLMDTETMEELKY